MIEKRHCDAKDCTITWISTNEMSESNRILSETEMEIVRSYVPSAKSAVRRYTVSDGRLIARACSVECLQSLITSIALTFGPSK